MTRCTLRNIFTILLYAGVAVFLYPYFTGHFGHVILFLVAGIGLAVLCGVLRCYFEEGDCTDREFQASSPCADAKQPSNTHPHAPSHP